MSRAVFFISTLGGGGAQRVCVTLANCLAERGYLIDLTVMNLKDSVYKGRLSDKVKVTNLDCSRVLFSFVRTVIHLKKTAPNLVLSFNRQISVMLIVIRFLTRSKFKIVSRNTIFLSRAEASKTGIWHGFLVRRLVRLLYARSDKIVAQCKDMEYDLVRYLRIPEEKVVTIYNPVSSDFEYCDLTDRSGEAERFVLCVGRLDKQKRFEDAIYSIASLRSSFPELRLKILGEGVERDALQAAAERLSVSDRVDFLGFKEIITPYYKNALLTVLTSRFEGFPNVLIESILSGTPVVAYDCPSGPSEIVRTGVNGYLAREGDRDDLVKGMVYVMSRKWDYTSVVQTGSRFTCEKIVSQYESLLF